MMLPAAMMILIVLGAIAVDGAVAFLGHRHLADAAAAAANDAAAQAMDEPLYRATGRFTLDPAKALQVVRASLIAQGDPVAAGAVPNLGAGDVLITPGPDPLHPVTVIVTLRSQVGFVFSKAVPGAPRVALVTARASATVVLSPGH